MPPAPRWTQPSLVGALVLGVVLDLALRRVLVRLAHLDLMLPAGGLRDALDWGGALVHHGVAVLGAVVALGGIGRLIAFSPLVPRGGRAAVAFLGMAFAPLVVLGVFRALPPLLAIYLQGIYVGLVLLIVAATLMLGRGEAALWPRLALVALAVPVVLHLSWYLGTRGGGSPATERLRQILLLGELAAAAAGAICPFTLLPRPRPIRAALLGGLAFVGAAAGMTLQDRELGARILVYAVGVEVPSHRFAAAAMGLAGALWMGAVVALLSRSGPSRLRGYGLLLVGLAGFDLGGSAEISVALAGWLCLAESLPREAAIGARRAAWRRLVEGLAERLAATSVQLEERAAQSAARLTLPAPESGPAVRLALIGDAALVTDAELTVGEPPTQPPALTIHRRGTPRYGRVGGPEVATGDLRFDDCFRVHDGRRLTGPDPILDDETRRQLIEEGNGFLAVWPGTAVRYRTHDPRGYYDGQEGELRRWIELLSALRGRG